MTVLFISTARSVYQLVAGVRLRRPAFGRPDNATIYIMGEAKRRSRLSEPVKDL